MEKIVKFRQIRTIKLVKGHSAMTCHVFTAEATKDGCALKNRIRIYRRWRHVFPFRLFFAFFSPWMAKFVIIRFIIEECMHKSASSPQHCNCAMNRLFTENLSWFRKCFARVTHAHATTSWIFARTSDDLSRFHFSPLFFLTSVAWLIYLAHPSVLGPKWWLVARVVASSVHCDLFNCSKIEFFEIFPPSLSHLN